MTKQDFKQIVDEGIARGKEFMIVKIEAEGNPATEIIINPAENFVPKMRYYLDSYNHNMELTKAKESGKLIRVVEVLMTSNLNDLSWFAY